MAKKERWKTLPKTPEVELSNLGNIRYKDGREGPAICQNARGYLYVNLKENGERYARLLARLVGELHCPHYDPELRTGFVNGDKTDCSAKNIRSVSHSSLCKPPIGEQRVNTKLKEFQVLEIRRIGSSVPHDELAVKYDVSYHTICEILKRETWRHLQP